MKFFACLFLLLSMPVFAQEHPRAEVFGGYSYLRSDLTEDEGFNAHGWAASYNTSLNKWFGLKADFSGHYRRESANAVIDGTRLNASANLSAYTVLFGPQFTYRPGRVNVYGHVLAGFIRARASVTDGADSLRVGETAFALAAGGGFDVKVVDKVWLRPLQADVLISRFRNEDGRNFNQYNLRLSTGVVIRDK